MVLLLKKLTVVAVFHCQYYFYGNRLAPRVWKFIIYAENQLLSKFEDGVWFSFVYWPWPMTIMPLKFYCIQCTCKYIRIDVVYPNVWIKFNQAIHVWQTENSSSFSYDISYDCSNYFVPNRNIVVRILRPLFNSVEQFCYCVLHFIDLYYL